MEERSLLIKKVRSYEDMYNPSIRMLRSPFRSPGYHTTLKDVETIHSTRNSLIYALALLDTELPEYERRGMDVIAQIVSLQDTDRNSPTFGIWSWFYEEPLDRMSPPDWNWADFCGKQLVLAWSRHRQKFDEQLREGVRAAICNACDAIIKRDVGPHYTNIAIMGAFVTLLAGERLGIERYAEYGLERLRKLANFTRKLGAFQEFNSPPYSYIAILELSKIYAETERPEAKAIARDLLDVAWDALGNYFHAPTKQWAGPHFRCYETLLTDTIKAFLQMATGGRLGFFPWEELPYEEEWFRSGIACPERVLELLERTDERRLSQRYAFNESTGEEKRAYAYMNDRFALGSFRREILWNQTRPLLGYIDNGGRAAYFRFRCLHDGYDYCSAVLQSAQRDGQALFGVEFLTNGGDAHPNLDKIDGSIIASDFRLRLEFGGALDSSYAETEGGKATIRIGRTGVHVRRWFGAFDEGTEPAAREWEWEIERTRDALCLDLVVYRGEPRTIDFRALRRAAFLFSLSVGDAPPAFELTVAESQDTVAASGPFGPEEEPVELTLRLQPHAK